MAFTSHSWLSNWGRGYMGMGPGKFARSRHWRPPRGEIAFPSNKKYRHFLSRGATAVLITEADPAFAPPTPWSQGPLRGFLTGCPTVGHHPAAGHGYPSERRYRGGCNWARVHRVPMRVIESGVVLGDDVRDRPGLFYGKDTRQGSAPRLGPTSPSITT